MLLQTNETEFEVFIHHSVIKLNAIEKRSDGDISLMEENGENVTNPSSNKQRNGFKNDEKMN